jgi:hypothetical protein
MRLEARGGFGSRLLDGGDETKKVRCRGCIHYQGRHTDEGQVDKGRDAVVFVAAKTLVSKQGNEFGGENA